MGEEKVVVHFPNEGAYTLSENLVRKWKITESNVIGDVVFCKTKDSSSFSMLWEDYKRIFIKKQNGKG